MACILRGTIAAQFAFGYNVAYHSGGASCRTLYGLKAFFIFILHYFGMVQRWLFPQTQHYDILMDTVCMFDLHKHVALG